MSAIDEQPFCYLTTIGRVTGRPHRIEIWWARSPRADTIYVMAGGGRRADWVRNIERDPSVNVRIGAAEGASTARLVETDSEEDALARSLLVTKYQTPGTHDLAEWGRSALPVAVLLPEPMR